MLVELGKLNHTIGSTPHRILPPIGRSLPGMERVVTGASWWRVWECRR